MSASRSLTLLAAAACLVLVAAPHDADARGRRVEGTASGAHGSASGWSQTQRERGSRTHQSEWTGSGGRTRSVDDQRTWSREDGTYSHDRDVSYRDGTSRHVDSDVTRTAPGEYSLDRSVTGRNGETRTQTGEYQVSRTP